jgi:hypothetical protein
MSRALRHPAFGLILSVALLVAGFCMAFDRGPSAEDARLAAYELAGGSVGDLCGEAGLPGQHHHRDCPLCHPAVGLALAPPVLSPADPGFRIAAAVFSARESRAVRAVRDPGLGLRAPPVFL